MAPANRRLVLRHLEDRITPDAGDLLRPDPNPQPISDDQFGAAVAVNSEYIVVGAPFVDVNDFPDAGAAFVFDRDTGELLATIPNPEPAPHDRFGWSVVLWAGSGWIGAPYDDPDNVTDSGSVYSYSVDGGIFAGHRMGNPTPAVGDLFGYSLATEGRGNWVAIGAPGDDAGAVDAGRAYLTSFTSGIVMPSGTTSNPTPNVGDRFGESVAVTLLGYLLAGAPGDDAPGANDAGRAFLCDFDAQFAIPIENPAPAAGDRFGTSVAVGGISDIGLIGAPGDAAGGIANAGAAYAFDLSLFGISINLMATLENPDPTTGDRFGAAVAADGIRALIGAPGDEPTGVGGAGSAYEFRTSTGEFLAPLNNPAPGNGFGSAVALAGSRGVVGNPFASPGNVAAAGAAYLFDTNNRPRLTDGSAVVPYNGGPTPVVTLGDDSLLPDWGDFLTIAAVTQGVTGGVVLIAPDARSVTYAPLAGFVGTDSFTYTVDDANGGTATATVNILVADPPPAEPLATLGPANPDGEWAIDGHGVAATDAWVVVRPNEGSPIRVYDAAGTFVRTLPNPGLGLSTAIAVSGNRALIGHDQTNEAYLYDLITGALLHTLRPPAGTILFGISVALDGDTAIVGTYEDYEAYGGPHPSRPGRAFVFDATTGALVRTIANPTFDYLEEGFGTAVAVDGNTLVVGAYRAHVAANLPLGQAYVFDLDTGALRYTLNSAVRHYIGFFGAAVAVDGNRVAVGGREQVYMFDAMNGEPISQMGDPTFSFTDAFGMSLALAGDRVLVGAAGDDPGGVADAGAAYLFDADTGTLLRSFDNPVPAPGHLFGATVALTGDIAVIGTLEGNPALGAGAAYLFDADLPPTVRDDTLTLPEDSSATAVVVLANDFAVPLGNTLTVTAVTQAAHGTVSLTAGVVEYTPAPNYFGPDSFTYSVTDDHGATATATVLVTVTAVNDAPTLPTVEFTIPENSSVGTAVGTVAGTDPDGDSLAYAIIGGNTGGAFAVNPTTGAIAVANAGPLDFETTPTFTLTVEVSDPGGLTATATVTIRLTDVLELPPAKIDIQPGDSNNVIVRGPRTRVTVAILWRVDFDPRQVNVYSLRFGRTGQENSLIRDPYGRPRYRFADVNGDGKLDLVADFEVRKTGFRLVDTRGFLTARMRNGTTFAADDAVQVR